MANAAANIHEGYPFLFTTFLAGGHFLERIGDFVYNLRAIEPCPHARPMGAHKDVEIPSIFRAGFQPVEEGSFLRAHPIPKRESCLTFCIGRVVCMKPEKGGKIDHGNKAVVNPN